VTSLADWGIHRGKVFGRCASAPVHVSWLSRCENYFSVRQRKALTPNDFHDVADIRTRLAAFEDLYPDELTNMTTKCTDPASAEPLRQVAIPTAPNEVEGSDAAESVEADLPSLICPPS